MNLSSKAVSCVSVEAEGLIAIAVRLCVGFTLSLNAGSRQVIPSQNLSDCYRKNSHKWKSLPKLCQPRTAPTLTHFTRIVFPRATDGAITWKSKGKRRSGEPRDDGYRTVPFLPSMLALDIDYLRMITPIRAVLISSLVWSQDQAGM